MNLEVEGTLGMVWGLLSSLPTSQPFLSSSLLEPFEAMVIITRAFLALKGYSTLRISDTFFGTYMCQALGQ